ncbi:hypothetical protein [Streptomyces sp. T028]|uniref:hypothetical protein n=1 Tax=Streptomyces sp. T028 TaxID=3394379 RepID=UPI003A8C2477
MVKLRAFGVALLLALAGCGTQAATPGSTPSLGMAGITATDQVVATTLPVDQASDTYRTMLRQVVPVDAGDLLDIEAWARITNETGYVVGIGWHVWAYDVDSGLGSSGPWTRISPIDGDNVDPPRHHMPLAIDTIYQVPADWPTSHRITVVLRADAHSTAAVSGDTVTVDQDYGHLTVRRWIPLT